MRYPSALFPRMMHAAAAAVVLLSCAPLPRMDIPGEVGTGGWEDFFPAGMTARPVTGLREGEEAYEVLGKKGRLLGWFFRTDRVDPEVKGLVDQIAVLVAVSKDRRIIGVRLLEHGEAPAYMERLTEEFYDQFRGLPVDDDRDAVDAVTGATVSSSAVAADVFLSCRRLLPVTGNGE